MQLQTEGSICDQISPGHAKFVVMTLQSPSSRWTRGMPFSFVRSLRIRQQRYFNHPSSLFCRANSIFQPFVLVNGFFFICCPADWRREAIGRTDNVRLCSSVRFRLLLFVQFQIDKRGGENQTHQSVGGQRRQTRKEGDIRHISNSWDG